MTIPELVFILCLCIPLLSVYAFASSVPSGNPLVQYYQRPSDSPPYPERPRFLVLKGSWYEMGKQYGEGAGDYMRAGFNLDYLESLEAFGKEHVWYDVGLWEKAIQAYSPQIVEFLKGMSDGAAGELVKSKYQEVGNYQKVLFLVTRQARKFRHPAWKHWPPGCSCLLVGGAGTKDGKVLYAHNRDTSMISMMWNVAFLAQPSDPRANKFWSHGGAGTLGYHFVNDKGLALSNNWGGLPASKGSSSDLLDFGIPFEILLFHTAAYAKSTPEAVELATRGTPEYAQATGRSTVAITGSCTFSLADRQGNLTIVERLARYYAIRRPGDLGEPRDFIVTTNHNTPIKFYDENLRLTNELMTKFSTDTPGKSSSNRYWTLWWLIEKNFGRIDGDLAQEFLKSHFFIDKDGKRTDSINTDKYGSVSAHLNPAGETVCAHHGFPENYANYGTMESTVVLLGEKETEFRWSHGRPCHWQGPWDRLILK